MSVNLDLQDPVLTVVNFLKAQMKKTPQTVLAGATRGGFTGANNLLPPIEPIEGEAGKKRIAEINVHTIKAKCIILVYEVSYNEPVKAMGNYADVTCRVSIDQRLAMSKAKLDQLDREVRRICMLYHRATPGGNWSYIEFVTRLPLTDKSKGLYRYVRDINLFKTSDYIGHQ